MNWYGSEVPGTFILYPLNILIKICETFLKSANSGNMFSILATFTELYIKIIKW